VASHDLAEGGEVRRASGGGTQEGGDFAEVGWAKDARGDDEENLGSGGVEVVETVDRAARDNDDLTGAELSDLAFDCECEYALEAVCGFFVGVVAVRDGDLAGGGYVKLEHGDGVVGLVAFDEVTDGEAT
jgi:hypothetical protein